MSPVRVSRSTACATYGFPASDLPSSRHHVRPFRGALSSHFRDHKGSKQANQNHRSLKRPQATSSPARFQTSSTQQGTQPLAFDWSNQWYPVLFVRDLPEGLPQRVYIFDEPIVLLKRPGQQGVVALKDRCPHRAAALSEGRMTPDGQLQCAYHGWSFDGESGICTNIPQVRGIRLICIPTFWLHVLSSSITNTTYTLLTPLTHKGTSQQRQ